MRKADNLPPSCAVVTKSGNLNLLEPSGPVQACNGTALPLVQTCLIALQDTIETEECFEPKLCDLLLCHKVGSKYSVLRRTLFELR